MEPGLYDKNNKLLLNWNELLDKNMIHEADGMLISFADKNYKNAYKLVLNTDITGLEVDCFSTSMYLKKIYLNNKTIRINKYCLDKSKIESVEVDLNNSNYSSQDGVLFNKYKTTLLLYPPYKKDEIYIIPDSVEKLSANVFSYNDNLRRVLAGENMKMVCFYSFLKCRNLEEVIFNGLEKIDDGVFYNCENLKYIKLPGTLKKIGHNTFFNSNPEIRYFGTKNNFLKINGIENVNHLVVKCNDDINLDLLISEGYSLRDANKIIKQLETER